MSFALPRGSRSSASTAALIAVALVALASLASPTIGRAQESCDPPAFRGPLEVMPASGAQGVRLDAPIRVIFTPAFFSATPAPAPQDVLEVSDGAGDPVVGVYRLAGDDTVFFHPMGGWEPTSTYQATAFGDVELDFEFRTGTQVDVSVPTVGAIVETSSTGGQPLCGRDERGFRVDVSALAPTDDGAPASLEYSLYLSRASGLPAPERVARVRNFLAGDGTIVLSFVLPPEYADEAICVQLQVTDGVGNVAIGDEHCFDPVEEAHFFALCRAAPSERSSQVPLTVMLALVALTWRRLRVRVG